MHANRPVSLRFSNWSSPDPEALDKRFFRVLFELVTERPIELVFSPNRKVDIELESVYLGQSTPNYSTRLNRFVNSYLPKGIDFSNRKHSTNQQPAGNASIRIFFTGENERPPEGRWDAYLSFDQHSYGGRNAYLPLWWITSTDILLPTVSPYLGEEITLEQMLSPRKADFSARKKFCIAFIGKAYPFRMHALSALSQIGRVDVYGAIARNTRQTSAVNKFEISQDYRFVFAFENDLFPGYVTEKAPEAWATGAVPLYWGSDPQHFFNDHALINLEKFPNLEEFIEYVRKVDNSKDLWENHASQPLLTKKPNLELVIQTLRSALAPILRTK